MVDVDEGGSAGARLNEAERAEETMLAQGPLSAVSTVNGTRTLQVPPEKLFLLLDRFGLGLVVRNGYDRVFLATLSEGIVHLRLKIITDSLLIGDVGRGNRREYRVFALDLAGPVKEDAIVLVGPEDFRTQGPCPVRL